MIHFDYVGIHYTNSADFSVDLPQGTPSFFLTFFLTDIYIRQKEHTTMYPSGTVLLYAPASPQSYHHPTSGFSNDWIQFSGEPILPFLNEIDLPFDTPFPVKNASKVHDLIAHIEQEFFSQDYQKELMMELLLKELLLLLSREYHTRSLDHDLIELEPLFRSAKKEILSHLEKDWTIENMAALTGLSPSRFSHVYRTLFHISPKKNLLLERINKARFLITSQNYSVTQAAICVGYDNIYHFSKQFKKVTGKSPSHFRTL